MIATLLISKLKAYEARLLLCFLALYCCGAMAQQPMLMQQHWEHNPDLGVEWVYYSDHSLTTELIERRVQQLNNPDQQQQLEAAQWFVTFSAQVPPETQQTVTSLMLKLLEDKTAPRPLRQVLASAVIAVNSTASSTADALWHLTKDEDTIRPFVENALIQWKLDFAADLWRARLSNPQVLESDLLLALRGLADIGAADSAEAISQLIEQERFSQPLLLQACDALGQLSRSGREQLALRCLHSKYTAGELMAARLIANHSSPEAGLIAAKLITAKLQPARRLAFRWHAKYAPQLLPEMNASLLTNDDSGVRSLAIEHLCGTTDTDSLKLLGDGLKDDIPLNRQKVRDGLIEKGRVESMASVVSDILRASLQPDFGEGSEQAIEVVVSLKDRQFNMELIDLLDHPLSAIRVRAAWGLQEVEVQEPEQLAAIFARCSSFTKDFEEGRLPRTDVIDVQWAYLLSVLGKARYQASAELMKKFVPKAVMPTVPRASAIWSLGNILQGSQDSDLAQQLGERMLDNGRMGEDISVRYASAVAMGFIAAPSSQVQLKSTNEYPPLPVGLAAEWALKQLK